MKTLKAVWAIERAKSFGPAAEIAPGDVFDSEDAEATRLVEVGAAVEATAADIAVAEATGHRFAVKTEKAEKPAKAGAAKAAAATPAAAPAADAPLV